MIIMSRILSRDQKLAIDRDVVHDSSLEVFERNDGMMDRPFGCSPLVLLADSLDSRLLHKSKSSNVFAN